MSQVKHYWKGGGMANIEYRIINVEVIMIHSSMFDIRCSIFDIPPDLSGPCGGTILVMLKQENGDVFT